MTKDPLDVVAKNQTTFEAMVFWQKIHPRAAVVLCIFHLINRYCLPYGPQ